MSNLRNWESEVGTAFAPLKTGLVLDDERGVVRLTVEGAGTLENDRWRGGDLEDALYGLCKRARDTLLSAGYERHESGWVDPATAEFLRTEPHPVFL